MAELPYLGESTTSAPPIPFSPSVDVSAFEVTANKGTAGGYAPLDGNAKVPAANLPDSAALDAEVDAKVATHNSSTTSVHGIANTANLVLTDDARLSDARTPTAATAWNASHTDANGIDYKPGTLVYYSGRIYRCLAENDAIQPQQGGNAYWQDLGLGNLLDESHSGTTNVHGITNTANLVLTDDARLTNARTPTSHAHSISDVTGLQAALDGKQASGSYAPATGIAPSAITGTAVVTNDSRLSDPRTPTAHTHSISEVTSLQSTLTAFAIALG